MKNRSRKFRLTKLQNSNKQNEIDEEEEKAMLELVDQVDKFIKSYGDEVLLEKSY